MKIKKSTGLLFLLIIIGLIILASVIQKKPIQNQTKWTNNDQKLQFYADQVIQKCASTSYHPTCYNTEITNLMDTPAGLSMEDAFKVTEIVQGKDSSFPYCHVLGHDLSAKEVKKDPSKWKDVVTRCPSGVCSNGCIHGGFQEKFRTDALPESQIPSIMGDLRTICEKRANWNPTGLEQGSCYHALGHLTMYITSANINKSISICNDVALKSDGRDFRRLCYDGVFMQIYQPLEPEDFALIKGKEVTKDTVDAFCNQYTGAPRGSCISESWPLFRNDLMANPANLLNFCGKEEPAEATRCFEGVFYTLTVQFNFDSQKLENYCAGLSGKVQELCFANVSSRFIETDYKNIDKSVDFCNFAPKQSSSSNACFNELLKYSTFNFHNGSEEMIKLCQALPNPWNDKCLAQIGKK